jgi:hypothetical protein
MSFSPTVTYESVSISGVSFTVHRIGIAKRAELDRKTLSLRQQLRELELDYPPQSQEEEQIFEQLDIAKRKAAMVSEAEREVVIKDDVLPLAKRLIEIPSIEVQKKRRALDEEYATIKTEIRCAWIKAGLVSINGGEYDGVTVDQFLEFGSLELAGEIFDALNGDGRLAGPAAKNSQSPGISGDQGLPAMTITTAENVSAMAGTFSATAFDISSPASTHA